MASSSRAKRRRGKEPMVEESEPEYDRWKFKSWYHQLQLEWMNDKKIYPEVPILLQDKGCQEIKAKIKKRRWEELTSPITKINANIIREFYANIPRLDMNTAPTYKIYARGMEVDFSSKSIMKVLGLRTVHFDELGYHQRISEDPNYDMKLLKYNRVEGHKKGEEGKNHKKNHKENRRNSNNSNHRTTWTWFRCKRQLRGCHNNTWGFKRSRKNSIHSTRGLNKDNRSFS
ncbi:hypothetical protein Ahy_B10g103352 isoform B [Arachis hypogaea]|uniref:Putative plant transposon protein domain-containing protein n=1 Tax=Arachis hypogaea TaxID=3818 RepID=A0A444X3K1_ARAHY|nr:hypothetical protein Ahy_B10g103352 isoform B [Arachis hypogaea]